jgi:hypothetical protein
MPTITEGKLTFTFPPHWIASKYDNWSYYRNQFIKVSNGIKAVDILALNGKDCFWLMEVKDYREGCRTKAKDLAEEIAEKVKDTLAGVAGARFRANDTVEKNTSRDALQCKELRVVLHLEQPSNHSKLFPRAISPASVLQRLKQLIKSIDPHPKVVEMGSMNGIPWQVISL